MMLLLRGLWYTIMLSVHSGVSEQDQENGSRFVTVNGHQMRSVKSSLDRLSHEILLTRKSWAEP